MRLFCTYYFIFTANREGLAIVIHFQINNLSNRAQRSTCTLNQIHHNCYLHRFASTTKLTSTPHQYASTTTWATSTYEWQANDASRRSANIIAFDVNILLLTRIVITDATPLEVVRVQQSWLFTKVVRGVRNKIGWLQPCSRVRLWFWRHDWPGSG